MAELDFWYEFASTYSYLAAMRCDFLAQAAGVRLRWRPFLLGPIFSAQGWMDSPFNLYPAKGHNMWRDLQRQCEARGLPLQRPHPFPQNSVVAARVALAVPDDMRPAFSRAVFRAQFGEGRSIADVSVLTEILECLDLPAEDMLDKAKSEPIRALLRDETERARRAGLYGAPTFVAGDGELFWGDDRLEQALAWAQKLARQKPQSDGKGKK